MDTKAMNHPARTDREDEKKMLPCRYYINGFCHKGNRCRFYHPVGANFHCAIKVPPMPETFILSPRDMRANRILQGQGDHASHTSLAPTFTQTQSSNPLHRVVSSSGISLTGSGSGTSRHIGNSNRNIYSRGSQVRSIPSVTSIDLEADETLASEFDEVVDVQNTVFNHIDWSEFLAPGKCPPPPTHVPEGDLSNEENEVDVMELENARDHGDGSHRRIDNLQKPVQNASTVGSGEGGTTAVHSRKLSAKEELQMKVKQIAKELADEPIQHVRSLDSFFRNYDFSKMNNVNEDGNTDEFRIQKCSEESSEDLNDSFQSAKEDSGDE